jgi:hypothetical protein
VLPRAFVSLALNQIRCRGGLTSGTSDRSTFLFFLPAFFSVFFSFRQLLVILGFFLVILRISVLRSMD